MALMALSGAAALAYEAVWMRMLSRAFGVTVYAVAALVAVYMAGLALGAFAGTRLRWQGSWLRLYAWLEAGAGLAALLGTWWMLRLPAVAAGWAADRPFPSLLLILLTVPALLPATCLLGATLPVLTRHCGARGRAAPEGRAFSSPGRDGVAARLYGANTLGAMSGLALVSFWTIGAWGEAASVALAVGLNLAAAAAAAVLSRGPVRPAEPLSAAGSAGPASGRPALGMALFALSGFCALGYEVIWSRQLVLLLGNSTYAFAMLLIVYLGGIGLGSLVRSDGGEDPGAAFAATLTALGCAAVLSVAGYRYIGLGLDSPEFLYSPLRRLGDFPLLFMEAVVIILPVAVISGMLFPAAVRLCRESCGEAAAAGRLYAWNTVGGIAGSLWAGFFGVKWLGAHRSFLLLAAVQVAAGLFASLRAGPGGRRPWRAPALFAAAALLLLPYVWRDPTLQIIKNRLQGAPAEEVETLFHDESPAATITGLRVRDGRILYVNGIETSGKGGAGVWMAMLPSLLVPEPRSSLVICLGAGNTLRAAAAISREVDGVELIADVARRIPVFQPDWRIREGSARLRLFIEDGRNYLLRARRRYDVIIVDATPPLYSAGTVNLYTKEFMGLARSRLEDGGIFTLWLPTKSFAGDYWQILRGMADVFEHVAVWDAGDWSGFLVLGSPRPLSRSPGFIARRFRSWKREFIIQGMDADFVRRGFTLSDRKVRELTRGFAPVTDDRPSVEFPLPRFWRGERLEDTTRFLYKGEP
jgi:spermidine synthase